MEQQYSNEKWQVEVGGQVYDASLSDLGEWIGEGSLQPTDKVRKGNLRWIEAQKVPNLIPFFNAKANGEPMPVVVSTADAALDDDRARVQAHADAAHHLNVSQINAESAFDEANPVSFSNGIPSSDMCAIHTDVAAAFLCQTCCNGFCKVCPKSYGGTVKICPMCGSMCKPVGVVMAEAKQNAVRYAATTEGFGMGDFFNAVAFPFRFKSSLLFGAIMFTFFSFGQSASSISGILMMSASLMCFMLANMLTFGVLANTVNNFTQGKLDENFMPSFDDFSIWDDVVHPFFLSIAVYVTSFGPFVLTLAIGIYLVISTVTSQLNTFQSEIERLPGTQYYAGREPAEQSQQVKKVLGDIEEKQKRMREEHERAALGDGSADVSVNNTNVVIDRDAQEQEELWRMAQESRKAGLESALGKTQETREREFNNMVAGLLNLAGPLVIIGAITFFWGVFYFSAACAVAGYTRSFIATINPLVGLDTIKRLGLSYVKIMLMGFVMLFAAGFVSAVFALVFAPFDLPGIGNIPAKVAGSFIGFYLSVVFSCVIGYALFKNAEKLQLFR